MKPYRKILNEFRVIGGIKTGVDEVGLETVVFHLTGTLMRVKGGTIKITRKISINQKCSWKTECSHPNYKPRRVLLTF